MIVISILLKVFPLKLQVTSVQEEESIYFLELCIFIYVYIFISKKAQPQQELVYDPMKDEPPPATITSSNALLWKKLTLGRSE